LSPLPETMLKLVARTRLIRTPAANAVLNPKSFVQRFLDFARNDRLVVFCPAAAAGLWSAAAGRRFCVALSDVGEKFRE
jgi:hypothetical protein